MDFQAARKAMVDSQLRPNKLTSDRTESALREIPRERFLPKALREVAYVDEDLPLGNDRYLMEPMVFCRMLDLAALRDSDTVLDVGCGTGYSSAVLGLLANTVVALEADADLAKQATEILAEQESANVAVVEGDLQAGLPKQGPFDVIMLNGAVEIEPTALLEQLAEGGRLVCVLADDKTREAAVYRRIAGKISMNRVFDAQIPLLPGFEMTKSFVF